MNLLDSSFLCLDIGGFAVRGMGVRISAGRISSSQIQVCESPDAAFAIKHVADALESGLGIRFDSAYVTGNFGGTELRIISRAKNWGKEHRITESDISLMVSEIPELSQGCAPMHIIPLRYDLDDFANVSTPVGQTGRRISAMFGVVSCRADAMSDVRGRLRAAHMTGLEYFNPAFLLAGAVRPKKESSLLIDLGASSTTVSLWTARGPMFLEEIPAGQSHITDAVAGGLNINWQVADRLKRENMSLRGGDMDRFTPASPKHDFTRADVNDLALPVLNDIIERARAAAAAAVEKYRPAKIYLSGGGAALGGIDRAIGDAFGIPVENMGANASVQSLASFVWGRLGPRADAYSARRRKRAEFAAAVLSKFVKLFGRGKKRSFVPIMPTTLAFDMRDPATYAKFRSACISAVHVDVMDGLFVERIAGGIDELKFIRANTYAHLNVHLMAENPGSWAAQAAAAGADTIIVSTGTYGVRAALMEIKNCGKRAGVALHPDSPIDILKPILRHVDEVLVLSIHPGAGGQKFMPKALSRIEALADARKKYGLKFTISVDGGINPDTAKECWKAGADFLASGTYLANAADFPAAVQSLLPDK